MPAANDPNDYNDSGVRDLCAGLLDRTLAKLRWTHHGHLAATLCLVRTRSEGLERDLPGIIRAYNESVGGVNDDTQGYHETITQAHLAAIRASPPPRRKQLTSACSAPAYLMRRWATATGCSVTGRESYCFP